MSQFLAPLVGSYFRPPAQAILANLPGGSGLTLAREPGNEYDPFAVAVFVAPSVIPPSRHERLAEALQGFGKELEDTLGLEVIHLGYVDSKKTGLARQISTAMRVAEQDTARAVLRFDPQGNPQVEVEI